MAHLWAILAPPWAILAPQTYCGRLSDGDLAPSWLHLGPSWLHLGPSWLHLEPSWVQLASPKVLFRGCKSAIRYAKVLFRGCKSAIRYAKTQNRLSPLWAPSDLGWPKRNTYATFFLTLHSLWAPSDFFLQKYHIRHIQTAAAFIGFAWFCLVRFGAPSFGAGNLPAYRA